jgi:hypothetical protein
MNEQYAQYGMAPTASEYVTYVARNSMASLFFTIVMFMLGHILDAIRRLDPKNYMTEEEFADLKAAKKEAKDAKKIAKGEKAAAKAKAARELNDEDTMAEDFANDLDKVLKAEEKKGDFKKSDNSGNNNNKRHYNVKGNGYNNRKPSGNRNGGNRNNNGNRKNNSHGSNQNKPKSEESKNQAVKENPSDKFEVKVSEDK